MEKFSVKRPFTILVAVIAVIVLGFVSVMSIPMDLLPQISLPYMLVIGDRDIENGTVSVRTRTGADLGAMTPEEFKAMCRKQIDEKDRSF